MPVVYFFGNGEADGGAADKALLGGKGANLAEMTRLGLPVPPGFTITTETCNHTFSQDGAWPEELEPAIREGVEKVGGILGKSFSDRSALSGLQFHTEMRYSSLHNLTVQL